MNDKPASAKLTDDQVQEVTRLILAGTSIKKTADIVGCTPGRVRQVRDPLLKKQRDLIWNSLIQGCASDPTRATRIVLLDRDAFDKALKSFGGGE